MKIIDIDTAIKQMKMIMDSKIDTTAPFYEIKGQAIEVLEQEIEDLKAQIEDWRSREYKKSGKTILLGTNDEQGDTPLEPGIHRKSVDRINEKRKVRTILNLEREIEDHYAAIKSIKDIEKPTKGQIENIVRIILDIDFMDTDETVYAIADAIFINLDKPVEKVSDEEFDILALLGVK